LIVVLKIVILANFIISKGRTNALKLHHQCRGREQIRYIDYTSLYPYVQKYMPMPTVGFLNLYF